ncbi:phage virion morphogenesis protein [Roseivirga sp. UBA1976]|uniref:phage virion morphogenesis protein n=1 Tax=Roseivirga sp. UBA1976 TaxID=1947386 RepID=UPI00257971DB|nr:phage virion morphogenesis protein [Roseivirga sp. UBA1976]|tara:strand:- start:3627 stop:4151 length:525 start_codon:yes stop_codon:yes gene_type:complete
MAKRKIQQFGADLRQIQHELKQFIQTDLPRIVGTEAVNHFKESFDNEGFTDKRKKKWKPRAFETKKQKGKKIMHGDGDLEDSLDYRTEPGRVIIFSDKEYAQIHNEGGKIPVTPLMRKFFWAMFYETGEEVYKNMAMTKKKEIEIPARTFMAFSEALNRKIEKKSDKRIDQIFK